MKININQRGFVPVAILIGALILVLIAGGIYLGIRKNQLTDTETFQETSSSQPPASSLSISSDTKNWQTYTNKKYGIEFMYPKELYVWEDPYNNPNNENRLDLNKDDCKNIQAAFCGAQDSFFFRPVPAEGLTFEQWIKSNLFKESNIHNNPSGGGFADDGGYCYERSKQDSLTVAGIAAKSFSFSWDQLGHPGKCQLNKSYNESYPDIIKEVYFSKNGWVYIFDLRYKKGSDLEKTFNQTLSTVRLLDQPTDSTNSSKIISTNKTSPTGLFSIEETTLGDGQTIIVKDNKGNTIVDNVISKNYKEIGYGIKFGCQCGTSFKGWVDNSHFAIKIVNGNGEEYEYLVDATNGKIIEASFKRIK